MSMLCYVYVYAIVWLEKKKSNTSFFYGVKNRSLVASRMFAHHIIRIATIEKFNGACQDYNPPFKIKYFLLIFQLIRTHVPSIFSDDHLVRDALESGPEFPVFQRQRQPLTPRDRGRRPEALSRDRAPLFAILSILHRTRPTLPSAALSLAISLLLAFPFTFPIALVTRGTRWRTRRSRRARRLHLQRSPILHPRSSHPLRDVLELEIQSRFRLLIEANNTNCI